MFNGDLQRCSRILRHDSNEKLIWEERVKKDIKEWNISKGSGLNRSEW